MTISGEYNKETDLADTDKEKIEEAYPQVIMKIDDPFEMKTGPMAGRGRCIGRRLTPYGVLFAIHFADGSIRDWEWCH